MCFRLRGKNLGYSRVSKAFNSLVVLPQKHQINSRIFVVFIGVFLQICDPVSL